MASNFRAEEVAGKARLKYDWAYERKSEIVMAVDEHDAVPTMPCQRVEAVITDAECSTPRP